MFHEGDPVWVQGFNGQVLDFTRSPAAQLHAELNAVTEGYTGPGVMWADESPNGGALVQVGQDEHLRVPGWAMVHVWPLAEREHAEQYAEFYALLASEEDT